MIPPDDVEDYWEAIDEVVRDIYDLRAKKDYDVAAFSSALMKISALIAVRHDISKKFYTDICAKYYEMLQKAIKEEKVE